MKKLWIPMVLLLLLLAACMSVPEGETESSSSTPSSSTPSSSSITPPSSSITPPSSVPPTVPTTQPAAPTTPPPSAKSGHVLIFKGPGSHYSDWWPKEGLIDHLYWVVEATKESILLCDEPVYEYAFNDTHIFFVKESEPTKVYATSYNDFATHELIYESTYGNISYMGIESDLQGFLQFVADSKKFVVFDLATGKSTLLMEQDYIVYAWLFGTGDGVTWSEIIEFAGIATGKVYSDRGFTYNYVTGELGRGDK